MGVSLINLKLTHEYVVVGYMRRYLGSFLIDDQEFCVRKRARICETIDTTYLKPGSHVLYEVQTNGSLHFN